MALDKIILDTKQEDSCINYGPAMYGISDQLQFSLFDEQLTYSPMDDITILELSKCFILIQQLQDFSKSYIRCDFKRFITDNKLERHFEIGDNY